MKKAARTGTLTFEASLVYNSQGYIQKNPACGKKVPMKSETAINLVWLHELLDNEYSFLQELYKYGRTH